MAQSVASMTMAYSMINMQAITMLNSNAVKGMRGMPDCHKALESMKVSSSPEKSSPNCCEQECDCLTTGCATVPIFLNVINYTSEIIITNKIVSANPPLISQIATSLYRPPIIS